MMLVCLCPTYRRPRLVENAIACFLAQDYPPSRRYLLILDDAGQIAEQVGDRWEVISSPWRYPTLPAKYNALAHHANLLEHRGLPAPDGFCVWEDDDVYLPWHLRAMAEALGRGDWAKPSRVLSTYGGRLHEEPADGRFHASLAVRASFLARVGGWPDTPRADFDQQFLRRLAEAGAGADPCAFAAPSYVFRWDTGAYHGQAAMRSPADTTWYDEAARRAHETGRVDTLTPRMDPQSRAIYAAEGTP